MDRRDFRIARMQHQRDAGRGKVNSGAWELLGEILGHLAMHFREVDAGLLEHAAIREHARAPPAAPGAIPGVFTKSLSIGFRQRAANAVLQLAKIVNRAAAFFVKMGHGYSW